MKKLLIVVLLLLDMIQATDTFSYYVLVPASSSWGLFINGVITNNGGKAGILTGQTGELVCAPSLPYGVTAWSTEVPAIFVCANSKKSTGSQKKVTGCLISTAQPTKKAIDFVSFLSSVQTFADNTEADLEKIVTAFPNYQKGQAQESSAYLSFAGQYAIDYAGQTSSISTVVKDIQSYFPKSLVTVALDFTQLQASVAQQQESQQQITALEQQIQEAQDQGSPF